jgi:NAD(P)-dependent dehydrogenase (short-subunit alcohol dehydrogenase family)
VVNEPTVVISGASKHALESLSDSLRVELRPWAIEMALVEPGTVRTPMWDKGIADVDKAVRSLPEAAHRLYGTAMARMRSMAIHEAAGGVPPEKVAEAVIHALTSRRPRTRYPVGRDARAGIMLARLPDWLGDRLLTRVLKLPTDPDRTAEEPAEIAAPQEAGV